MEQFLKSQGTKPGSLSPSDPLPPDTCSAAFESLFLLYCQCLVSCPSSPQRLVSLGLSLERAMKGVSASCPGRLGGLLRQPPTQMLMLRASQILKTTGREREALDLYALASRHAQSPQTGNREVHTVLQAYVDCAQVQASNSDYSECFDSYQSAIDFIYQSNTEASFKNRTITNLVIKMIELRASLLKTPPLSLESSQDSNKYNSIIQDKLPSLGSLLEKLLAKTSQGASSAPILSSRNAALKQIIPFLQAHGLFEENLVHVLTEYLYRMIRQVDCIKSFNHLLYPSRQIYEYWRNRTQKAGVVGKTAQNSTTNTHLNKKRNPSRGRRGHQQSTKPILTASGTYNEYVLKKMTKMKAVYNEMLQKLNLNCRVNDEGVGYQPIR